MMFFVFVAKSCLKVERYFKDEMRFKIDSVIKANNCCFRNILHCINPIEIYSSNFLICFTKSMLPSCTPKLKLYIVEISAEARHLSLPDVSANAV